MTFLTPFRAAACGVLLTLAACSDPAATSTGSAPRGGAGTDTSAAAAAVTAAKAPQASWPGPTTPVNPPTGRRIAAITCGSQGYGCVQAAQGVAAAGKVLGWDVSIVDGKSDPSVWNAAVTQAVTDGADGIVLAAINPALVQDGLARAKAAGTPVVVALIPALPGATADAYVSTDHLAGGKTLADWVIADSGGTAKVLLLEEPAFPELVRRNDGIRAELEAACPGCTIVATPKFSIGTMVQQLPGLVTTALQSNPGITHVLAPFDSSATFAAQGIRQSGRQVALVSGEGDPDGLTRLRNGEQAADLATVSAWAGWASVDQLARLFTGGRVESYPLPQRLFTADNVPSGQGSWRGDVDYVAEYSKLWGK
jgi:ribose transport system substrate-binding protein